MDVRPVAVCKVCRVFGDMGVKARRICMECQEKYASMKAAQAEEPIKQTFNHKVNKLYGEFIEALNFADWKLGEMYTELMQQEPRQSPAIDAMFDLHGDLAKLKTATEKCEVHFDKPVVYENQFFHEVNIMFEHHFERDQDYWDKTGEYREKLVIDRQSKGELDFRHVTGVIPAKGYTTIVFDDVGMLDVFEDADRMRHLWRVARG